MLQEKSSEELEQYESLLENVFKIYGQDMNQFTRKLLKSINEKLESFTIPKKRKRKTSSSSDSEEKAKKQKIEQNEWIHIAHVWPNTIASHFAELIAGLNVAQSINVWKHLSTFLVSVLNRMKSSSELNENVFFKIDFASSLLCDFFSCTRLHEQIMTKKTEIAAAVQDFNQTQHSFYEAIVNNEYNSRVMYSFLKLSCAYENFTALFFYHHNPEIKEELYSAFVEDQTKLKEEWKIIQQRIKNFGKIEEINQLNALMMQQCQRDKLFTSSGVNNDDLLSIVNDYEQLNYLLRKDDTRSFLISALGPNEMKSFAQYLISLKDEQLKTSVVGTIARDQLLLDGIIAAFISEGFDSGLETLNQLPLECLSDESKKKVFTELLHQKPTEQDQSAIESVIAKLFKNDSYKTFFKDFTMEDVVKVFEPNQFIKVYHPILSNAARKLNVETLKNFNWILDANDSTLQVLAQVTAEV